MSPGSLASFSIAALTIPVHSRHFGHSAEIPIIAIAIVSDRDPEIELLVTFVGLRSTQVPGHAGPPDHDPGKSPVERVLPRHDTDIDIALLEYAVFGQQLFDVVQNGGEFVGPIENVVQQVFREVLVDASRPEIRRVQPGAARSLVEDHEFFAFVESPKRRRQGTHVHRLGGHVQQVVENTADFTVEYADKLRAPRDRRTCQPFDRKAPGVFLVHRRHIIQPVEIRQVLKVGTAFHQFFRSPMEKPDMRVAPLDNLAIEFQDQPQHAMRRRVLRTEIDVEVPDAPVVAGGGVEGGFSHVLPSSSSESRPDRSPGSARTAPTPSHGEVKSKLRYS